MNKLSERWPSVRREGIVANPQLWATSAGYEFQYVAGSADKPAALSSTNDGLPGYGWTMTSILASDGTSGDFLSSSDVTPTNHGTNAAGDELRSPRIFGSYSHALQASRFLGYMPTKLNFECYARWSVASANEAYGMGCSYATSSTVILSNGTNFFLTSGGTTDVGAAVDTNWHLWRLEIGANTEWFIDNVSQGSLTTTTDAWPGYFGIVSTTTNRIDLAWMRVWYS